MLAVRLLVHQNFRGMQWEQQKRQHTAAILFETWMLSRTSEYKTLTLYFNYSAIIAKKPVLKYCKSIDIYIPEILAKAS